MTTFGWSFSETFLFVFICFRKKNEIKKNKNKYGQVKLRTVFVSLHINE